MPLSFTVRNITFVASLFFGFTTVDSAFKILFSHQVLGQWRENQKVIRKISFLAATTLPRPPVLKHFKPEAWCSTLYNEESVFTIQ